jgi:DNA polymerase-3 subunit gamma/tau
MGKVETSPATPSSSAGQTAGTVTPFQSEDLLKQWDAYAESIETNAYLKGLMVNCKPVLLEEYDFEVAVHNPGQREELLSESVTLLATLRDRLKNDRIRMKIRISETNEKKLAYTTSEKYEHLMQTNPLLGKLKNEFNLVPD